MVGTLTLGLLQAYPSTDRNHQLFAASFFGGLVV